MRSTNFKLMVIGLLTILIIGSLYVTPAIDTGVSLKDEHLPTKYSFDILYDNTQQIIKGKIKIELQNSCTIDLNELYFHIFPNAFTNWKWEEANKPVSEGYLKITEAKVNNLEVFPHQNETLLKLDLPAPLNSWEEAEIELLIELKIPERGTRLNQVNNTVFLAQWYPMLAVFDEEGWHLDPYTTTGDPFFSEIADYHLKLTLPKGYTVISSANDHQESTNQKQEIILAQKNIRDFALVITKDYQKISESTKDRVLVNLYYLSGHHEVAGLLLGSAVEAMEFFNDAFGPYPMDEIDIVLADAGYGIAGMEYPGLVTSDAVIKKKNKLIPAYNVVAHELAHQWWYGVVGNNQIDEPWLDEGLTSFSEYLYMEEILKMDGIDSLMNELKLYTDGIAINSNINVLQSIYSYGEMYGPFIYGRPAAMLWELKQQYGKVVVKNILKKYYQQYKFKIATTEDFIKVVNEELNKDMSSFFKEWLIIE